MKSVPIPELGRGLVLAVAAVAVLGCSELEIELISLGAEDGVPSVDYDDVELGGFMLVECTGSASITGSDGNVYTVEYTELTGDRCQVAFRNRVQVFDLAQAQMANATLGGSTILQVIGIALEISAFSLSDPATGAPFDTGTTNVVSMSILVDGEMVNANLSGPFPQLVDLGDTTVANVSAGISNGTPVEAEIDLGVILTSAGRSAFPDPVSLDFHAQPIVEIGVGIH